MSVHFHPQNWLIYLANGQLYDPTVLPSGTSSPVPVVQETLGNGAEPVFIFWRRETHLLPAQTLNCVFLALQAAALSIHQPTKLQTLMFYTSTYLEITKLRDLSILTTLWILLPGALVKNSFWLQGQNIRGVVNTFPGWWLKTHKGLP